MSRFLQKLPRSLLVTQRKIGQSPPALLRSFSTTPSLSDSFMRGTNRTYMEEMYQAWRENPSSVHKSWDVYFRGVAAGTGGSFQLPPTLHGPTPTASSSASLSSADMSKEIHDHLKVQLLIRAYQVRGHHLAKLDPLGIDQTYLGSSSIPEVSLENYGFTERDLDRSFYVSSSGLVHGILAGDEPMRLRDIVSKLQTVYSGHVGFEYMHIPSRTECNWIRERIEDPNYRKFTVDEKKVILDRLLWADSFERFIAKKWKSEKRFGLEGGEVLIPGLKEIIDRAADLGTENVIMGMPHRGRLNVLGNVVRKPIEAIFSEFTGTKDLSDSFSGDVKYHLGMTFDRPTRTGKRVHLSLVANPSHLEAVNPVVMGKARAMQYYSKDEERNKTLSLLMHGDAAFAGQGVVYESLEMSNLPYYTTGGVIHVVVNNQIGFTTDPRFARSSPYCTDVAMAIQAPIFHVNGDDPEAVVMVSKLAAEYRHTFKKDVVIDLICYRKHGHNEIDQPSFTQPLMYKRIANHPPVLDIYVKQLVSEGTITEEEFNEMKNKVMTSLENSYEKSKNYKFTPLGWTTSTWMAGHSQLPTPHQLTQSITKIYNTGVSEDVLKSIGKTISSYPEGFKVHPVLEKILNHKLETIESGQGLDMPTAEALAFGSLLLEGVHVRLSGQDVERGTFSQRHAVLHDQNSEETYTGLNHIENKKESITICNSHLSEYAVMGFELGYSLVNPNSLVIWEAQFGDFANTAQAIIDQFIASGEKKWLQRTGLVLSLPHGYDGGGPEHSSARIERFLQLCNDDPNDFPQMAPEARRQIQDANMQVIYPSTPANLFHALRRQIHRDFRKPLVLLFSKALLRHPMAKSDFSEMKEGTRFLRFIPESNKDLKDVKRVILCSGQVYYSLLKARTDKNFNNVAIARVEQISPFPYDHVLKQLEEYPSATEVVWAQEEPQNAGAWTYVEPRLRTALKNSKHHSNLEPIYIGRETSASTATGNKKQHIAEEEEIVQEAFKV